MISEYFIQAAIVVYLLQLVVPEIAHPPLSFVTSLFLITDVLLLAIYCIILVVFRSLEEDIGETHFVLLYFIGGVVGNLGLFAPLSLAGVIPVSGAMGGVFALAGAFAARHPYELMVADLAFPIPVPAFIAVAFMIVLHAVFNMSFDVFPLIIGWVYGYALGEAKKPLGEPGYYRR